MSDRTPISVEPIVEFAPGCEWSPVVGDETVGFLERVVPEASRSECRDAAVAVIARGASPGRPSTRTGLAIGYVQSGKTMSFETAIALARDNDFQVVLVIAGTANNLLDQSQGRLRRDLQLDEPGRGRRWLTLANPASNELTIQTFRDAIDAWRDPATPPQYKRTVLITVLKHHRRLQALGSLLRSVDMSGVPTLIVDDEADQASFNNEVSQDDQSATYSRLMELREALPNHTYLQYTATPQAPLLVSIADSLSPDFVQVLEPGAEYVGGKEFFDSDSDLVRVIPPDQVPTPANPLAGPPESLLEALRLFIVGVAVGLLAEPNVGNRSMLVHPSQRVAQHREYYTWVRDVLEEWKRILALPDNDLDRDELLDELRLAHCDLTTSVGAEVPSFDSLIPYLRIAFRNTRVLEVNASGGSTPLVDWTDNYAWILVGGQAMDRGFTVRGLTITYMPRGVGAGNADTVQQRARFLGYKRSYLGYCRVYLEQGTLTAFERYVEHEESIRSQLKDLQSKGLPLKEWKRAFVLDSALRPCRRQVLEFEYMRGQFSDRWVEPRVVLSSAEVMRTNREAVRDFADQLDWVEDDGHDERTDYQRHRVVRGLLLSRVLEHLLVLIRNAGVVDSQRHTGLLLQLERAAEADANETCDVYLMSPTVQRERGVDEGGRVSNLYQGAAPVEPLERRGEVYPGDQEIRSRDRVTVQIHNLDLIRDSHVVVQRDVPVIAVWVPSRMSVGWISQDQPGQAS